MVKSLSVVIMDDWAQSSEQECVKRLGVSGVTAITVGP